jgi:DNA-binding NarL/FixJ family response regulator
VASPASLIVSGMDPQPSRVLLAGVELAPDQSGSLASAGLDLVGVVPTGMAALRLLERQPRTVIVVGATLTDLATPELVRRALELGRRKVQLLVAAPSEEPGVRRAALDAGAAGVIVGDVTAELLCDAVCTLAAGRPLVDRCVA